MGAVISIEVDRNQLVERISGRFSCRNCGEGYHDTFKRPVEEGTCDKCGGHEFKRRPDDQPETVKNRLEVYHRQTAPLIDYYGKTGKVTVIDGDLSIEKVSQEIDTVINPTMTMSDTCQGVV